MSEIEPIADIKIIKEDIFDKIKNIKSQSTIEGRDTFYLPILEDLYGSLLHYEQYNSSPDNSDVIELERKSVYSSALAWYRKMMEHLYFAILLNGKNDEEYTKYIKYRQYDQLKRNISEYDSVYGIQKEENLKYSVLQNLHGELLTSSNLNLDLYKEDSPNIKSTYSSFINLNEIHGKAWNKTNINEKLVLGGMSYERLYGLISYSIHSSPLNSHKLNFINSNQLDGFLSKKYLLLIKVIIQRYTDDYKQLFTDNSLIDMFLGNLEKGDPITVYGKKCKLLEVTFSSDNAEKILTFKDSGSIYKIPYIDLTKTF